MVIASTTGHTEQGALSGMLNAATIKFGGAEVGGHFWEEASMSPVFDGRF